MSDKIWCAQGSHFVAADAIAQRGNDNGKGARRMCHDCYAKRKATKILIKKGTAMGKTEAQLGGLKIE